MTYQRGAAIYGFFFFFYIIAFCFCFWHVFADSACNQLTTASPQACNLFRSNRLSGGLLMVVWLIWSLSWNKSPKRTVCASLFHMDETGSCRLLIMLGDGRFCKVQGVGWRIVLSVLIRWYHKTILRHHLLIMKLFCLLIEKKRTSPWYARNTRITQIGSSRILICRVLVDHSY